MRIWGYSPFVGSEVARFSRRYFFSGAVLAYAIISAYAWAGFMYDNICDVDNPQPGAKRTYTDVELANEKVMPTIEVKQDKYVEYCDQSFRGYAGLPFPPVSRQQPDGLKWMKGSQETLSNVYGWTSVAFLVGFVVLFFGSGILKYFRSWFR